MIFTTIIDINDPLSVSISDFVQSIGFARGGKRWGIFTLLMPFIWALYLYNKAYWHKLPNFKFLHSDKIWVGLILIGVFLIRMSNLVYLNLDADEAEWMSGAASFYDDPRFWLSVDGNTSGPLTIAPLSLIPAFGFTLSYQTVRLFSTLFYILPAILFTYLALRKMCGIVLASAVTIPLAFILATSSSVMLYNSEYPVSLLLAIGLYLYTSLHPKSVGSFLFLSGIVFGLFPYSKIQATPMGVFMALVFLWKLNQGQFSWKRSLIFILGGLTPSIILGIYLTICNLWYDFTNAYIINNFLYGTASGPNKNNFTFETTVRATLQYLETIPEFSYWLAFMKIGVLMAISLLVGFRIKLTGLQKIDLWMAWGLVATAIFCAVKPYSFSYHYQHFLLVPTAFIIGAVCATIETLLVKVGINSLGELAQRATMPTFFLLSVFMPWISISQFDDVHSYEKLSSTNISRSKMQDTIALYVKPDEKMAVWGSNPGIYALTKTIRGTRDGHTYHQIIPIKTQKYYLNRFVSDLDRIKPKAFVEAFGGFSYILYGADGLKKFGIEHYPIVNNYIKSNYELKAELDGNTRIYARKIQ